MKRRRVLQAIVRTALVLFLSTVGSGMSRTAYGTQKEQLRRPKGAIEARFEQQAQSDRGQESKGRIEGTVRTSDGQSVGGVSLTLRAIGAKGETLSFERRAVGTQDGEFSFAELPSGKYSLRADVLGFQATTREIVLATDIPKVALVVILEILPMRETIVVSETHTAEQLGDLPAQVTVLSADEVSRSAALTVDDFLKRVPSFSLFRRSSSLVSHPSTQGVSLRGIGASGASRTLVMLDGVPLNDPVGSWVYWSMIPEMQIEKIEVDEGGVSSLYGSSAMAGAIDIKTRRPTTPVFDVRGLWGTRGAADLDLFAGDRRGLITYSIGGVVFRTDGFTLIPQAFRGAVDVNANSQHETLNGRVDDQLSTNTLIFLSGRYFNEVRDNGTRLQNNATREGLLQAGLRSHRADGNDWQANFFTFDQKFRSSFSSIAQNRQSETLSLLQNEPAYGYGGNAQWSRLLPGSQLLSVGGDGRWMYARDHENVFSAQGTRDRRIPGQQTLAGAFFQDFWTPWWRLNIVFGARADYWRNNNASDTETILATNARTLTVFPDVSKTTATSRAGVVFRATQTFSLRAAFYQGFRAPTLDELYRPFRVGNILTLANANLGPEHVNGYEFGVNQQVTTKVFWRATLFADRLDNPVSSVTLSTTPTLITQQRQNLGYANVKGAEGEVNWRLQQGWSIDAHYLFNQSVVGSFAANPAIVGNLLPQVPKHRASMLLNYSRAKWLDAGLEGRYESYRYDDNLNQRKLGSYFVLNLEASRALSERWRAFVNIENVFNREYFVQTTPVPQIGTPIIFSGGVQFHWLKNR